MTCHDTTIAPASVRTAGRRRAAGTPLARVWATLLTWQARAHERRALSTTEPRLLRDMGLSEADVLAEARKPFWRA